MAYPEVPRITAEELKQLMDEGVKLVVVDTRSISSYDYGHIKGAVSIPYGPIGDPMDKLIVIYCDCVGDGTNAIVALGCGTLVMTMIRSRL